ncbi:hypothetical protein [Alloalcanivorax marinus]|uniref:hypothetical protein n=1 Tax=Alloalcanivorax marinus TaxID=1177169 RepID=UPI0019319A83|nr:hypothetical protein [Alloalcanivorax marinus]MBL7249297.1 hypothetical protein [Alloalcanivorax marinus]
MTLSTIVVVLPPPGVSPGEPAFHFGVHPRWIRDNFFCLLFLYVFHSGPQARAALLPVFLWGALFCFFMRARKAMLIHAAA